jgi:hypothetical protein
MGFPSKIHDGTMGFATKFALDVPTLIEVSATIVIQCIMGLQEGLSA